MTSRDLQTPNRQDLVLTLRRQLPELPQDDTALSPTLGGRAAADALVARLQPEAYERSRNFLTGDVTRLSAYLRHGVITLAEVRDAALRAVKDPSKAGKLINEFAWRDYWQRLYVQLGEDIWRDLEAYKTGFRRADYAAALPGDVRDGQTSYVCMDSFAHDLAETGYLHNHARMWLAAYVVHWRRVAWQAGARWFLEHLVDGDPASNNLSWQWVASTFSSKPYIFNRENLERYTTGVYCRVCPHATAGTCPFDQDYDSLGASLFPRLSNNVDASAPPMPPRNLLSGKPTNSGPPPGGMPLLWIHTDALNPRSPMIREHAEAPAVFLWDLKWLRESRISLKRVVFLAECLRELPVTVEIRAAEDMAQALREAAASAGATYLLAQRTPDPHLLAAAEAVGRELPVVWYDPPPFAESSRSIDLKRFSRYWQRVQSSAMQSTRVDR